MAHDTWTLNYPLPARRYARPYTVSLSDTLTDANLQKNGTPFRYIQNTGTSGAVAIAWLPDNTVVNIYLSQGQVMEGGHWAHAKTTGTGAGVVLIGFLGIEGVDA
jgi:hypothetical protein